MVLIRARPKDANRLGLYAEEVWLTGEQLDNSRQAFIHLALSNAAVNRDYRLDHGSGRADHVLTRRRRTGQASAVAAKPEDGPTW